MRQVVSQQNPTRLKTLDLLLGHLFFLMSLCFDIQMLSNNIAIQFSSY